MVCKMLGVPHKNNCKELIMTTPDTANSAGCYCVCHSSFSSRASCEHCNGQYLRGLQDAAKESDSKTAAVLRGLLEQQHVFYDEHGDYNQDWVDAIPASVIQAELEKLAGKVVE